MSRLVVVSNRLPARGKGVAAGGLAVALEAALKDRGGLWLGWSGRTAETPGPVALSQAGEVTFAALDLTPAEVKERQTQFPQAEGMFRIKCDVHPWMVGYVGVMKHPFFAVTGKDGQFTLKGLPAGTYTVEAWHEKLGTQDPQVTLSDGGTATVSFSFKTPAAG